MKGEAQRHKCVISPKVSPTQTHQSPTWLFLVEFKKLTLDFCFDERHGRRQCIGVELCSPQNPHVVILIPHTSECGYIWR